MLLKSEWSKATCLNINEFFILTQMLLVILFNFTYDLDKSMLRYISSGVNISIFFWMASNMLKNVLDDATDKWGIKVERVEMWVVIFFFIIIYVPYKNILIISSLKKEHLYCISHEWCFVWLLAACSCPILIEGLNTDLWRGNDLLV